MRKYEFYDMSFLTDLKHISLEGVLGALPSIALDGEVKLSSSHYEIDPSSERNVPKIAPCRNSKERRLSPRALRTKLYNNKETRPLPIMIVHNHPRESLTASNNGSQLGQARTGSVPELALWHEPLPASRQAAA